MQVALIGFALQLVGLSILVGSGLPIAWVLIVGGLAVILLSPATD